MNRAVELLKECKIFYLATMDKDQPRVRPLGAVAEINGKLYLCTNNRKDCFRQLMENPKVEVSGCLDPQNWIRITGTVKRDPSLDVKKEFLRQCPLPMYEPEDEIFEVFYVEEGAEVRIDSFIKESERFEI